MEEHSGLHISLAAEKLGTFLGLPITNTLLASWFVMAVLILIAFFAGRKASIIPNKIQNFFELVIEFALGYMENILGDRKLAVTYFPLIATIFLVIATANLFDFFPFFGAITYHTGGETVPLLRPVNTDLNVTLALAIISVIAIEVIGILALGVKRYATKFFNFTSPVNFIVGLIEFVSELSRFISFSFRLFGNIFAGEVLIAVIVYFVPYLLPVPLMLFETFVGVVQGAVFAMLTLFFIKLARTPAHSEGHAHEAVHAHK
jgi:F-type H+-transporting ATPase subunit a